MMPNCCGAEMSVNIELGRFIEAVCGRCGDVVYIKKRSLATPQMIDD